jgi:hypothetical protein
MKLNRINGKKFTGKDSKFGLMRFKSVFSCLEIVISCVAHWTPSMLLSATLTFSFGRFCCKSSSFFRCQHYMLE